MPVVFCYDYGAGNIRFQFRILLCNYSVKFKAFQCSFFNGTWALIQYFSSLSVTIKIYRL